MHLLNQEYISSLLYRHRDEHGFALYLAFFGFNQTDEPLPLFTGKLDATNNTIDHFVLNGLDTIHQHKNIMTILVQGRWYSNDYFRYINHQLQLQLPQNFQFHVIDLADAKSSTGWLLKQIMKSLGIHNIAKEDGRNLSILKKYIQYQNSEYKKKFYFVLFRSDNLSFKQLSFLKKLSIQQNEPGLPLIYFMLEGSAQTYQNLIGLRKASLDEYLYTHLVVHREPYDVLVGNLDKKLDRPISEMIHPFYLRQLCIAANGQLFEILIHSVLHRMSQHGIKKLQTGEQFKKIFNEIKQENQDFIAKSPDYKKNLQHKEYIFPPQVLRDGPSLNEANRFFRWIGWVP